MRMSLEDRKRIMIERHIRGRGIDSERIIRAFESLPRELFVPEELREHSYDDNPLPIGMGQTISQPYIVALMTDLLRLREGDKVLEIGTGSGYQAAILSYVVGEKGIVYTIERIPKLAERAKNVLEQIGIKNVNVIVGDGTEGLPDHAPYKGIVVTAAAPSVPQPLRDQLDINGRLVIPVGDSYLQELLVIERTEVGYAEERHGMCRFVPLIGRYGWKDNL